MAKRGERQERERRQIIKREKQKRSIETNIAREKEPKREIKNDGAGEMKQAIKNYKITAGEKKKEGTKNKTKRDSNTETAKVIQQTTRTK